MKLAFPNMGNLTLLLCAFIRNIGGECAGPLPTGEKTVSLGTKFAPNDACMPMKIVLGSFMEAYENGADTAVFFGGCGPCCFGYFAETFRLIFRQNAVKMNMVCLEKNKQGIKNALQLLSKMGNKSLWYSASLISIGLKCASALDEYEQAVYDKQAEITNINEKRRLKKFTEKVYRSMCSASSLKSLYRTVVSAKEKLSNFRSDKKPEIKIGIVGDIYSVIDAFTNKNIQGLLADMGAYTSRSMSISGWIDDKVKKQSQIWRKEADIFLPSRVGGFARETIGNAVHWAKGDYDGIIEIYPLNCMPESVARSILPEVAQKYSKPVMTFVLNEMSGEAGYITRLEAFVQMIERKKEAEFEAFVSRS